MGGAGGAPAADAQSRQSMLDPQAYARFLEMAKNLS
jgi:hypothetical protein